MELKYNSQHVDIVEYFGDYVLVQNRLNGELFLLDFAELVDHNIGIEDIPERSNIISLQEYKKCLRKTKIRK